MGRFMSVIMSAAIAVGLLPAGMGLQQVESRGAEAAQAVVADPQVALGDASADAPAAFVTRAYASVEAMKADSSLAAGDVAATFAYHAGGEAAGAGTYDIKAAGDVRFENASRKVDGGRYIALDNGLVAVLRADDEAVDLCQYGARGDGATDDSTCVQAAFDSGLATVRVSAGNYVCAGAIIPSGTSVVGAGRDACAFLSPLGEGGYGTAGPLGVAYGAHDVALTGVTVDGRRDVYGKTGVSKEADTPGLSGDAAHFVYNASGEGNYTLFGWLGGAEHVSVEGCCFKSNNSEAVKFVGGKDISFTGCEFLDVDCGIITQGGGEAANVTDLTVDGCAFDGHWFSEPISMFAEGSSYEGLAFTNNTFKNKPAGSAILLYSDDGERKNTFRDVTISGNVMQRCSGGLALYAVDGATILNNDLGGSTARLYGCSNMTFDRLAFKDCPQFAFLLRDCTNVKATGLEIDGFGISSQVFPAISVGDAAGGQNVDCSLSGTVKGSAAADGSWRSAVNATAGGVDLSGVAFDVGANVHALFVNAGVTGLAYHTAQDVSVYDGSGTLGNDIVVEHEAVFSGGAALDNWNRTRNTVYTLNWTTYANESFTHMQACRDGFTRTLSVNAVNSDAVLADGDGSQGSITWLDGGHTVAKGESATYTLVCKDGVWREQGVEPEPSAHVHDWGEWEVVIEPSATEPGLRQRACRSDPSHVEREEIAAIGGEEGEGSGGDSDGAGGEDGVGSEGDGGGDADGSAGDSPGSPAYTIILNPDGAWDGSTAGYAFSSSADFSKFACVLVDGEVLDPSAYDAESGSTKVTLHADYLSTLAPGVHMATIRSTDGEASTTFTIQETQGSAGRTPGDGGMSGGGDEADSGGSNDDASTMSDDARSGNSGGQPGPGGKSNAKQRPSGDGGGRAQEPRSSDAAAASAAGGVGAMPVTGDAVAPFALALAGVMLMACAALAAALIGRGHRG